MPPRRPISAIILALVALALAAPGAAARPPMNPDLGAVPNVASPAGALGISRVLGGLESPVFVTHAGDSRLFIVERRGRIRIAKRVLGEWRVTATFLDLRGKVASSGGEQGLLGLAFHPDYETNGRFYVNYTSRNGYDVVAEYRRSNASKANASSQRVVIKTRDPYSNHNGGWLGFKGRYLYIAWGDGGSGGDPHNNGQRLDRLLGKILRIDPLDPDGNGPRRYRIPGDNPLVGRSGRDEIYAWGLRNPWRDSHDRLTGDLWIGDVGQEQYEEIDHAGTGKGRNFGWRLMEGRHRYPSGSLCSANCRTLPIAEYRHNVPGDDNCSVTGGYVARRAGAALYGRYIFGDYCSGRMWSIPAGFSGGALPSPINTGLLISSFGEARDGTIYVLSLSGSMYRVLGT